MQIRVYTSPSSSLESRQLSLIFPKLSLPPFTSVFMQLLELLLSILNLPSLISSAPPPPPHAPSQLPAVHRKSRMAIWLSPVQPGAKGRFQF